MTKAIERLIITSITLFITLFFFIGLKYFLGFELAVICILAIISNDIEVRK